MEMKSYVEPLAQSTWSVLGDGFETSFDYDYAAGREKLLNLYQKGKDLQWDSSKRIDWTREIHLENPLGVPDEFIPIFGSPTWNKLNAKERANVRRHMAAWQFSQFMHGEQGALVCTAKIVQTVPMIDSKFYAATQVMDEARHVETYSRYLREKIDLAYPMNPHLAELLAQILRDPRWDMTYLGMQIMIEGVALGAFGTIRDNATEPTAREVNAYVMQDEARHVAFGLLALRDYYPQLTDKERDEREEFCTEAAYLLRDRFLGQEVWGTLGFDSEECCRYVEESELMRFYRRALFMRIVPTLRGIGLWGKRVQSAFEDMGVLEFASLNPEEGMRADESEALRLEQELRKARAA